MNFSLIKLAALLVLALTACPDQTAPTPPPGPQPPPSSAATWDSSSWDSATWK
jgi:hypothetical protein